MKILKVKFMNLFGFLNGSFEMDFVATDKITNEDEVFRINDTVAILPLVAFAGVNASGKTTALRLLNVALGVVVNNLGLNEIALMKTMHPILVDGSIMQVVFYHNSKYYQLTSKFKWEGLNEHEEIRCVYSDEELKEKNKSSVKNKKQIFDFDGIKGEKRKNLDDIVLNFLRDDDSMVTQVTKQEKVPVIFDYNSNLSNAIHVMGNAPSVVLQVLDSSIETINTVRSKEDNQILTRIKFKNSNKQFAEIGPGNSYILSSGTVKGLSLFGSIARVLRTGGYLLVDEVENHFHKELVKAIISIFSDSRINKKGAMLIFTTHYSEILDSISRKDNIYFCCKKESGIDIFKYADKYGRNDIKKSEIYLSGFIGNTIPSYKDVQELKEHICELA